MNNKLDWLPAWLPLNSSTAARCHLFGAATSIVLTIGIGWVASHNRSSVTTFQHGETAVDLNDATALIENADQWRELYTDNFRQSQLVAERAKRISDWLPSAVDWTQSETQLRQLSKETGLQILDLNQGTQYVGTRVGVLAASCEVQGSFASLCQFLSGIGTLDHPIACSEIQVQRVPQTSPLTVANSNPYSNPCRATLSLRIPFAAASTSSGLLLAESNHGN